jgi:hypothetical protein
MGSRCADQIAKTASLGRQMNYLLDEVEAMTGLYGVMPRRETPQPVVHTGPTNDRNVRGDRRVIGTIDMGTVQAIVSSLNPIKLGADAQAGEALATFIQAVFADKASGDTTRQELIDQIFTLSAEAAATPGQRKLGVIKALVATIGQTAATIATPSPAWEHLSPILEQRYQHI